MTQTQKISGVVVGIEGNLDWETCKTEGLGSAYHKVEKDWREKMCSIEGVVDELSDDPDNLFAAPNQAQTELRAKLEQEARKQGYKTGFEGEAWFMSTPTGKITQTKVSEKFVLTDEIDGAVVGREYITVELY